MMMTTEWTKSTSMSKSIKSPASTLGKANAIANAASGKAAAAGAPPQPRSDLAKAAAVKGGAGVPDGNVILLCVL
jgi:hypothetical protein